MQPQPVRQPSNNRTPLLIGAVGAVVVIIGIVLALTLGGKSDSGGPGKPQPGLPGDPIGANQPATNPEAEKVYDAALTGLADPDKFQTFLKTTAIQSLKDTLSGSSIYGDVATDSTRCYLYLLADGRTASADEKGVIAVLCGPGEKGRLYRVYAKASADGTPVIQTPPSGSGEDTWGAAPRTAKGVSPYGFWPMAG
ncbi:MAG: hypothetical protein WKF57_03620 [Nakamurella sp.]